MDMINEKEFFSEIKMLRTEVERLRTELAAAKAKLAEYLGRQCGNCFYYRDSNLVPHRDLCKWSGLFTNDDFCCNKWQPKEVSDER